MSMQNVQTTVELEGRVATITDLINNSDPADIPYYGAVLNDLRTQLADAHLREATAMAGPSGNYNMHTPPDESALPPQMYFKVEPTPSRKRSLGPAEWPEPKRNSGQPSPITPASPAESAQQLVLPQRSMYNQIPYIDLTESNFIDLTQPYPATPEPFPELVNAYTPYDNGCPEPMDAFTQDFMPADELVQFLMHPTPPGGGYGYQQQPMPNAFDMMRRAVPRPMRNSWDAESDSEEYGDFPLTGQEADAIEKLFENIKEDGETPGDREPTPKMMCSTLKEYQKIGLTWLLKMEKGNNKGGILADEMGLGKTVQALSLICANPPSDDICKTTLIIAPVALMRQWEKEIERHIHASDALSVYLYHGSGKRADFSKLRTYDVVLTTFGTLTSEFKQKDTRKESMLVEQEMRDPGFRRKAKDNLALLGRKCMWYRVIIDEAHNIKNRNAICSKAAADLQARHRLCMTGTPMMNKVDELYPLLRFLKINPYSDWTKYNWDIVKPFKNDHPATRKKAISRIQILLRSVMLRRQKTSKVDGKEVCTIPPKITTTDNVEFTDPEHELYMALQTKSQLQINKYIQKGAVSANYANVLVLLLRLRQACCHPHLIKDLSQPATEGIAEDDLLSRAQELNDDVIKRLKDFDSFECPICLEADPNPTIIIPCGHTVCGECVQKLIDPARLQDGNEEASTPKCPHCRGDLKAKLITDYKHFCKVHTPEKLDLSDNSGDEEESEVHSDEESSDDNDEDVDKDGNLAGFIVDDDMDDDEEDDDEQKVDGEVVKAEAADPDSIQKPDAKKEKGRKGKGKGKARREPKKTLAQLKKDSLRNKAAKKKYLRRLDKTYVPSAKIDRTVGLLADIAKNDPTEKTLIFSQFTSLLDLVEVPLYRNKFRYQRYDGSMKMDERADAVNAFMDDPNENIMLVSLKAGNAGLNLWKASQVILLDPFWNPFIEDQAVDRAHRMPQPREVTVHRVLVPETVEDRICQLQDNKREIIGAALDEQASKSLTRLNVQELRFLFGMS